MFELQKNIIPKPHKLIDREKRVELCTVGNGNFTLNCSLDTDLISEAKALILKDIFAKCCASESSSGYVITLKVDGNDPRFFGIDSDEAYYIDADLTGATFCGKSDKGVFYAATTFKRMCYAEGGKLYLATAFILDYPSFGFRAPFFECRYGTDLMTEKDWKDAIDYLADMKFNGLCMSFYNCWEYQYDGDRVEYLYLNLKKYPELKTPKKKKYFSVKENRWVCETVNLPLAESEGAIRRIAEYAKCKNITLVPAMATLGHNSLIPRMIPETSAIKENGEITGSGFCTNSRKAYEVLFDLMDEFIDNVSTPLGITDFQVGLDEVMWWDDCHCKACSKREKYELIFDHLIRVVTHLKEKGMKRIIVSHDMLFKYSEHLEKLKATLIEKELFDYVVIDWWTYSDTLFGGKEELANEVSKNFYGTTLCMTGYFNWSFTGDNNINVRNCARFSKRNNLLGMSSYTTYDRAFDKNYLTLAEVSWNIDTVDEKGDFDERYAYRLYSDDTARAVSAFSFLEKIMHNPNSFLPRMNDFDYYKYSYRPLDNYKAIPKGKDAFPGKAFFQLIEKEEESLKTLEEAKSYATAALQFFESKTPSYMNSVWTLTAKQYKVHANEILTLFNLYKQYSTGACNEFDAISILDTLISAREELMAFAEEVKLHSCAYTLLRNMTIFRQTLIDLREAFVCSLEKGERLAFDITDFSNITGAVLDFLR